MPGLRGDAAIVGIAEFPPKRKQERLWMGLEEYAELARLALDDAAIPSCEVDSLMIGNRLMEAPMLAPSAVAEYLGIHTNFFETIDLGGASGAAQVLRAAAAIEAGLCETAVCMIVTQRHHRPPEAVSRGTLSDWGAGVWGSPQAEFEVPFGASQGTYGYAMIANRYRHEFGLTEEQLARIAVAQRFNAQQNPKAVFYGRPITLEDVMNSPMICDPLKLLEIVMPCYGGAAIVVTGREQARRARNRPAWIVGAGEHLTHKSVTYEPSFTESPIKPAADRAFAMADIERSEVDLASLYDCYTITVLLTIEDAGFCPKGEGQRWVEEHDLTYRGDWPLNTHGGQLSFGQSGMAGGMSHITEAYLQLSGRAGGRQLPRCDIAYINGNGGIMSEQVSLILRGD